MRCQACGQENQPDHTFCTKCLEILSKKKRVALDSSKSIAMPPQSDHLVSVRYVSPPAPAKPIWGWMVLGLVVLTVIFVFVYG